MKIKSEEEKKIEKKEYMKEYHKQIIFCNVCNVSFARYNKDHHERTQKHNQKKIIFECTKKINDLENKVQQIKVIL